MNNDLPVLTSLTENSTQEVPVAAGWVGNYVLLLVLLCVFAGGTLLLLSLLLLFCHRCCLGGRRYSRASDDPEKTNTTYVEDSQPAQEITIRLDESDGLSASSCHDGETERFLSATVSTGRRVSFNESALYEQERSNQDKGRRYTLTEGDFHHLKKARLTNLHLAPPPSALKILTIMECESTESSTTNINETPAPKSPLAIYQPSERGVSSAPLVWMGQSLSGGLPGDRHHSIILDQGPGHVPLAMKIHPVCSRSTETIGDRGEGEGERVIRGERDVSSASGQTSVLQFFSKLRRHASLEGAGPYFRRWNFDSSQRAASLDAKVSPKRRPFQRQRAASETTDHTENDSSSLRDDITQPLPHTPSQTSGLQSLSIGSLSQPTTPTSPSASLSRLKVEAMVEVGGLRRGETHSPTHHPSGQRQDEGKEEGTEPGTGVEAKTKLVAASRAEAEGAWPAPGDEDNDDEEEEDDDDDLFEVQDKAGIREKSENIISRKKVTEAKKPDLVASDVRKEDETGTGAGAGVHEGADGVLGAEARPRADSGSSLSFIGRQESSEAPPSLYRDIWSLRASLEQYASSDQSSTDRESIRSDADSISSLGGAGARSGLDSCLSQDLDDETEGDGEGGEGGVRGASSGDGDVGNGGGGEGEAGSRKLLQMDSGYTSIEAPSRASEDLRLFGVPGGPWGKTASERRLFFTSSGRKGSVCESFEAKVFQEELEDEMVDNTEMEEKHVEAVQISHQSLTLQGPSQPLKPLHPQKPQEPPQLQSQLTSPLLKPLQPLPQPSPPPHCPRLRRRDYSIDEKTDALFNEFLRHDPRFDQQDSPLRSRHRSRVHLRKQWQRHKQYSDPGAGGRYSPSLERQRFTPLRRGDSAGYPLDTRYHSTLSRIASAADEEASEVAADEETTTEGTENKDSISQRVAGETTEGTASAACEDKDVSNDGAGIKESNNRDQESAVSTNMDAACEPVASRSTSSQISGTLSPQATSMEPRVDNRNNNSSQAILSEIASSTSPHPLTQSPPVTLPDPTKENTDPITLPPHSIIPGAILQAQSSLTEKLAVSLEERLYTGLRRAGQDQGPECVVTVSHTSSPGHSPV